jgi:pilin isopeptide linkage protein
MFMKKNDSREQIIVKMMQKERRHPFRQRLLALVLAMSMLLTSSGMQLLAEEVSSDAASAEAVTELTTEAADAATPTAVAEDSGSDTTDEAEEQSDKKDAMSAETEETSASDEKDKAETAAQSSDAAETESAAQEKTVTAETAAPEKDAAADEAETSAQKTEEQPEAKETEAAADAEVPAADETAVTESTNGSETDAQTEAAALENPAETEAAVPETDAVQDTQQAETTVTPETGTESETGLVDQETETEEELLEEEEPEEQELLADAENRIDLTSKLDKGTMKICIGTDYYTLDYIRSQGWTVDTGAPVEIALQFGQIEGVTSSTVLYYQIPDDMVTGFVKTQSGEIKDGDAVAGTYTITTDGLMEMTLEETYLSSHKEADGTTILKNGTFSFSGDLSSTHGETPGDDDAKIVFGDVEFDVPFKYWNYYGNVNVEKSGVFDPATRMVTYTVTVSAPSTNTMDAENITVTDTLDAATKKYISTASGYYYQSSYTTTQGSFSRYTGIWTVNTLKPGKTATLTYKIKLADSYFDATDGAKITNTATLKFNKTGTKSVTASGSYHNVLNISKSATTQRKDSKTCVVCNKDDDGNIYLEYTVTVTAPASNDTTMTDITVEDTFTMNASAVTGYQKIEVTQGDAAQSGTGTSKKLVWNVGSMDPNTTATMTYRAIIDPGAWGVADKSSSVSLYNRADVYCGGTSYDYAYAYNYLYKDWIGKSGVQTTVTDPVVSDKTYEGTYDAIEFTITANKETYGAPIVGNVAYFQDTLTGTLKYCNNLVVYRYTDSSKETLKDKTEIPIKDLIVTSSDTEQSWKLDMSDGSTYAYLNGPYYYELVYDAVALDHTIVASNKVTIGVWGWGGITTPYTHSASWDGGGAFSFDYSKTYLGGLGTGESSWKTTIPLSIPEGSTYVDYPYSTSNYWFTEDNIKNLKVMFNGSELVRGTDYEITTVSSGTKITKYTITFKKTVSGVSSSNPVTIEYQMHIKTSNYKTMSYDSYSYIYNESALTLYGITKEKEVYVRYRYNKEVTKTAGAFDNKTSTITWTLQVNRGSSFDGNAVIREVLPSGLSFVSAEITSMGTKATEKGTCIDTENITDAKTGGPVTEDTKEVLIPIKNLYQYADRTDSSYLSDGMVTLRIVTRVKAEDLLTLSGSKSYTNTAKLEQDGVVVSGSDTQTISGSVLSKSCEYGSSTYPYVKYTLTVNPQKCNLLADSDTIKVVDEMSPSMRLALEKADYLTVTDSAGNDITADCILEDNTNTDSADKTISTNNFTITVPDDDALTIVYYAIVNGLEGDVVSVTNRAHFEGQAVVSGAEVKDKKVSVQGSGASVSTGLRFSLLKLNESQQPIAGVKFKLYRVQLDSDGKAVLDENNLPELEAIAGVEDQVTDENGKVTFYSSNLDEKDLYCYIETEAPTGYPITGDRHYIEFTKHSNTGISGIMSSLKDATIPVINHFQTGIIQIPVVKTVNGGSSSACRTEFQFTLVPSSDGSTGWTDTRCKTAFTQGTASIKGTGTTTFDTLYFNEIGTYTYTLTESDLSEEAIQQKYGKDDSTYQITIVVEKAENNGLMVTSATFQKVGTAGTQDLTKTAPVFNNTYTASGSLVLEAQKVLEGNRAKAIEAGEFNFKVTENGVLRATGTTEAGDSAAAITFTEITYDQKDIGTHTYEISEIEGNDTTIGYLASPVTLIVEVVDNGDGTLTAVPAYPDGGMKFVNEYRAIGEVELTAEKQLTGTRAATIGKGEFTFSVKEGETEVATGETLDGGIVKFTKIDYSQNDIGPHTYVISEDKGKDKSIGYTAAPVTVTVTVSDLGGGKLHASVTYPEGGAKFVNEYKASGSVKLTATKELTGSRAEAIGAGEFAFTVTENGEEVATGATVEGTITTDSTGAAISTAAVDFTAITYDQDDIGKHTYVVSEKKGTDSTINYSTESFTVTVTVSDAGNGTLNTDVSWADEEEALFVNEYKANGEVELAAVKELPGRAAAITEGEFTFIVKENGTEVATGSTQGIAAEGSDTSEELGEEEKEEELAESPAGIGGAGDSGIKETGTSEDGETSGEAGTSEDGTFSGATIEKNGGATASVKFTKITYTQADIGTHTYIISENAGSESNIGYTAKPVTVTVEVSDAGNGHLNANVTYPDNASEATFTNTYKASGEVELAAVKVLNGGRAAEIGAGEFNFSLK